MVLLQPDKGMRTVRRRASFLRALTDWSCYLCCWLPATLLSLEVNLQVYMCLSQVRCRWQVLLRPILPLHCSDCSDCCLRCKLY